MSTLDTTNEYTVVIIAEYDMGMVLTPVSNPHTTFLGAVKEYEKCKDSVDKIMDGMRTPELNHIRVAMLHRSCEELPIVGRA